MNRLLVLLCAGAVILILSSCCCFCKGQPKTVTFKDSGKTIKTSVLKQIKIELVANATTGYSWEIVNYDKQILKVTESVYKPDSELLGAGGKQLYCFDVIGKGKTSLEIIYRRPWEKDIEPLKTFKLNIVSK